MKALIKCVGFIGDNLFASSIPRKLKQQGFTKVDLELSIAQPYELLNFNPDIDEVLLYQANPNTYDQVYYLTLFIGEKLQQSSTKSNAEY